MTDHKRTILKMMRNLFFFLFLEYDTLAILNGLSAGKTKKKQNKVYNLGKEVPRNRSILKKINRYKTATTFMECKQENKNYAYLSKNKGHFHMTKATASKNFQHQALKLERVLIIPFIQIKWSSPANFWD